MRHAVKLAQGNGRLGMTVHLMVVGRIFDEKLPVGRLLFEQRFPTFFDDLLVIVFVVAVEQVRVCRRLGTPGVRARLRKFCSQLRRDRKRSIQRPKAIGALVALEPF